MSRISFLSTSHIKALVVLYHITFIYNTKRQVPFDGLIEKCINYTYLKTSLNGIFRLLIFVKYRLSVSR